MSRGKLVTTVVAVAALAVGTTACGSSSKGADSNSNNSSQGEPNTFQLSEFVVIPPSNALTAGNVELTAKNVGSEMHEFVLVKGDSYDSLPKMADGSVDEDKIPESDKLGEMEDIASQTSKSKSFDLTPGKYVAFCNVVDKMREGSTMMGSTDTTMMGGSGHVHAKEGMHVEFSVS